MAIGVKINENDYSLYSNGNTPSPVLALIGTATKGPVGVPTLCLNQREFKEIFGNLKQEYYGTYAAQYFLQESSRLYYVRVADTTAKPGEVKIPGTSTSEVEISDLITINTKDVGTFYNGYTIAISNSLNGNFDFSIKTSSTSGINICLFKGVNLNDTSENYLGTKLEGTFLTLKKVSDITAIPTNGEYVISGGTDGIENTTQGIIDALDLLKSDKYRLDLLAIPGVSDSSVILKGINVCETRGDCIYLVDPPAHMGYQEVVDWHNGTGDYDDHVAFNSSFAALYWSWQYIVDEVNGEEVQVPPSVLVAPVYARSENMSKPWYAPAGLTRGLIKNALRSDFVPDSSVQELLYDSPNNINCIITHNNLGLAVFGQKTLYRKTSSLDRVNVRRLITYIKRLLKDACQYLVFEPNDTSTWNHFEDLVNPKLRSLVNNRGLYEYKIVKIKDLITDDDVDNYKMPIQILIKPTKSAEYIPIDIVVTATGVEFNSTLEAYTL